MTPNPTTRMLTTGEVLRLVFEYCDRRDNGRNALVSKNWSNEALPFVWSSIETLRPLLSLLAPLDVVTDATGERKYVRALHSGRISTLFMDDPRRDSADQSNLRVGLCS